MVPPLLTNSRHLKRKVVKLCVYALFLCVSVCVHVFACVCMYLWDSKEFVGDFNFFFLYSHLCTPPSLGSQKNIWRVFEGGKFNIFFLKLQCRVGSTE